jgi:hypothetical protein
MGGKACEISSITGAYAMPKPPFSRQLAQRVPNWTKAETDLIIAMQSDGATATQMRRAIQAQIGIDRSTSAIANRLLRLGRGNSMLRGLTWLEADCAQVAELAKQGWSASQIAARLGRSRNAVIGYCHRNGIRLARAQGNRDLPRPPRIKRIAAPRANCGRVGTAEWIASIPPARLQTDAPTQPRHPVHIRVAAARFLEWRACKG